MIVVIWRGRFDFAARVVERELEAAGIGYVRYYVRREA
jgi:hypothetical protein